MSTMHAADAKRAAAEPPFEDRWRTLQHEYAVREYDADPIAVTKRVALSDDGRALMREVAYVDLHYFKHDMPRQLAEAVPGETHIGMKGL